MNLNVLRVQCDAWLRCFFGRFLFSRTVEKPRMPQGHLTHPRNVGNETKCVFRELGQGEERRASHAVLVVIL